MAAKLRHLLEAGDLLVVPCAHDALSSRIIEEAGFESLFASGFCIAASRGSIKTENSSAIIMARDETICCVILLFCFDRPSRYAVDFQYRND